MAHYRQMAHHYCDAVFPRIYDDHIDRQSGIPTYEYAKATFPADPLGLTQAQRLDLALVAVDYLGRWDAAEDVILCWLTRLTPTQVNHGTCRANSITWLM